MQTIQESFPILYSKSKTRRDSKHTWEAALDLSNEPDVHELLDVLQQEQQLAQGASPDDFKEISEAIYADLIKLKQLTTDSEKLVILNYLQLSIGVNTVGYFNMKGMFHYSYDWIHNSIMDSQINSGDEVEYSTDLFIDLLNSNHPLLQADVHSLIVTWLKQLYYYSRAIGGHFGLAEFLLPFATQLGLKINNSIEDNIELLIQIAPWADDNGMEEEKAFINNHLMVLANKLSSGSLPIEGPLKNLLLYICINNSFPLKKRREYYKKLQKPWNFQAHERQQVASELYVATRHGFFYEELTAGIRDYINHLDTFNLDEIQKRYEKSRIFRTITNAVNYFLDYGEHHKLGKVLSLYYEAESSYKTDYLYIIPNHKKGVLYSSIKGNEYTNHDTRTQFSLLNESHNLLLNQLGVLRGKGDYLPQVPQRDLGFPNYAEGKNYESKAVEFYGFENIYSQLQDDALKALCLIEFNNAPVQALMLKTINKSLPISVSFDLPLVDREIKKVLIWSDGTLTSEFEAQILQHIFSSNGKEVVVVQPEEMSKDLFLKLYNSYEYDLLWLATHGEFKHYEPHKSLINISTQESVLVSELVSPIPDAADRRLLVLNMCESGMNADLGGIQSIGLGHLLTTRRQAVISHLWRVESRVALAYAFLLSNGLATTHKSYFEAFSFALLEMIKGKANILELMEKTIPTLGEPIDRIRNEENIDWDNILHWGSSTFTE